MVWALQLCHKLAKLLGAGMGSSAVQLLVWVLQLCHAKLAKLYLGPAWGCSSAVQLLVWALQLCH